MIPSSPRRTLIFLVASLLAFFWPDVVVPVAWGKTPTYLLVSDVYQVALALAGFWFGPAICRALVLEEVTTGPLRQALDESLAELRRRKGSFQLADVAVHMAAYPAPFVVTAGLLTGRCQVFLSSALVERVGIYGLRFTLARALAHAGLSQRLAALSPVLAVTVMVPATPADLTTWLRVAVILAGWLVVHWVFELRADRQAARAMGEGAETGLREVLAGSAPRAAWLSVQPPLRWRLHIVGRS